MWLWVEANMQQVQESRRVYDEAAGRAPVDPDEIA
jgi:hypothetical protein